jgi:hypothetical protein
LLIPIVAFAALLWNIKNKEYIRVVFFSLLAIIGAFAAKGTNPLFGGIYEWVIRVVPGSGVYRDPTKFYFYVALSYAMLLPLGVYVVAGKLRTKKSSCRYTQHAIIVFFVAGWLMLSRQGLIKLVDTFSKPAEIPAEYITLAAELAAEPDFGRTLWIPQWQRYGFFSDNHPAIGRFEVLTDASAAGQIKQLQEPGERQRLERLAVTNIIVAEDSLGEIFLDDRIYDETLRREAVDALDHVTWLRRRSDYKALAVYETEEPRGLSWIEETGESVELARKSATHFAGVSPANGTLVLSQAFDPGWVARFGGIERPSVSTPDGLNSFSVSPGAVDIVYTPQRLVWVGSVVSLVTLAGGCLFLVAIKKGVIK